MSEEPEETTLGDIAEVVMGQSPPGSTYNEDGDGLPFLQGSAEFGEHYPVPLKWCSQPKKIAEAGDLLVSVRAPVGDTNFADQRTAIGRGLAVIRGKGDSLTEYLRLVIQTRVSALNAASGSGMFSSITAKNLKGFRVDLPPLSGQRRTVDLITSVDLYIDALRVQADAARTARTSLLHELLNAGGDDWVETTLGEVATVGPKELPLPEDAPFVPMDAVDTERRWVRYSEPRGLRNGARARADDVLFARITPCLENGKVAQVPIDLARCGGSTELLVIRASEAVLPAFIYFWAKSPSTRTRASSLMTGTTGRQRLAAADLRALPIGLPPLAGQGDLTDLFECMSVAAEASDEATRAAVRLRSALVSDLLSGNHEIPESYDALLEAS